MAPLRRDLSINLTRFPAWSPWVLLENENVLSSVDRPVMGKQGPPARGVGGIPAAAPPAHQAFLGRTGCRKGLGGIGKSCSLRSGSYQQGQLLSPCHLHDHGPCPFSEAATSHFELAWQVKACFPPLYPPPATLPPPGSLGLSSALPPPHAGLPADGWGQIFPCRPTCLISLQMPGWHFLALWNVLI